MVEEVGKIKFSKLLSKGYNADSPYYRDYLNYIKANETDDNYNIDLEENRKQTSFPGHDWHIVSNDGKKRNKVKKKRQNHNEPDMNITGFDIQKMPSCSTNFPTNEFMQKNIIPRFPFSLMVVGQSGSGKTNLIMNLFKNKDMYKDYFDEIILFAATGMSDDLFRHLGIDDDHIIEQNMTKELKHLIAKLDEEAKTKGPENMKKRCIIFEDATSEKKLQNSEDFGACWVRNRHDAYSVVGSVHKYKGLHRTCRLNAAHKIIFPTDLSDVALIVEDCCPSGMTKKQFTKAIEFAFTPEKDVPGMSHPFLYINGKAPENIRFRKTFSKLIDLNYFKKL